MDHTQKTLDISMWSMWGLLSLGNNENVKYLPHVSLDQTGHHGINVNDG